MLPDGVLEMTGPGLAAMRWLADRYHKSEHLVSIAMTGASGNLGGRVVEILLDRHDVGHSS